MDVKYIGGDVPWTLPFGDHFYSSSHPTFTDARNTSVSCTNDIETIARRYNFEPLYSKNEQQSKTSSIETSTNLQWMNSGVLFTDKTIDPNVTGIHKTDFNDDHTHSFCYLCSINQHQHESTNPRDPSKRRKLIPYNNPKALKSRSSSLDRTVKSSLPSGLMSYRFIIRTGTEENCGTRAQVFLYIYGSKKNWTSINLRGHKNAKTAYIDGFPPGSIRTFCLKGPDIGNLDHLNVNLVGARSDKAWFLKEIEITNLDTSVTWLCEFNCWLPGGEKEKIEAKPTTKPHIRSSDPKLSETLLENLSVYILQVRTGTTKFAGTDSNINVMIRGSKSKTGQLILASSEANLFENNQMDTFAIVGWDLGDLLELTVESDKSHFAAEWYLKEMIVWKMIAHVSKTVDLYQRVYFPFNNWVGKSQNKVKIKAESYPSKDYHLKGPTCYHIIVKTGDEFGAGTDANVYIIIYGESGRTSIHQLDNSFKNDFEKNSISEFTIMDNDVGKINRIKIWHDNTKPGAAWLLQSVTIRKKHSTCRPISTAFVERLKKLGQIFYDKAREQIKKEIKHQLSLTKEDRPQSGDEQTPRTKDSDDLASNRSILRTAIPHDKTNRRKNVRWEEFNKSSWDEEPIDDTRTKKVSQAKAEQKSKNTSPLVDSGHFKHQAYWVSTHNYSDKKWHIDSVEASGAFDIDEKSRSILMADRSALSSKSILSTEKDDDIYQFQANRWLKKEKHDDTLEVYLTPSSVQLSKDEMKSNLPTNTKHESQRRSPLPSPLEMDHREHKHSDERSKLPSKRDFSLSEKSLERFNEFNQLSTAASKTKLDNPYSSSVDRKYPGFLKGHEEMSMDNYRRSPLLNQQPLSSYKKHDHKIPLSNERQFSPRLLTDSTNDSKQIVDPSKTVRPPSASSNHSLKSPRVTDDLLSRFSSRRDFSEKTLIESKSASNTTLHSHITSDNVSRTHIRNATYKSAYDTISTNYN